MNKGSTIDKKAEGSFEILWSGLRGDNPKSTLKFYILNLIIIVFLSGPLTFILGPSRYLEKLPYIITLLVCLEYLLSWRIRERKPGTINHNGIIRMFKRSRDIYVNTSSMIAILILLICFIPAYLMYSEYNFDPQISITRENNQSLVSVPLAEFDKSVPQESPAYAIIHPAGTDKYYTRKVLLRKGTWTIAFRPDDSAFLENEMLEIKYVSNPAVRLQEDKLLYAWPSAEYSSPTFFLKTDSLTRTVSNKFAVK